MKVSRTLSVLALVLGTAAGSANAGTGYVITPMGSTNSVAYGGVVASGDVVGCGLGNKAVSVLRYDSDGSPDTSFGGDGQVSSTQISSYGSRAMACAVQPDGKIIAAGFALTKSATETHLLVARYNPNGTLDTTFAPARRAGGWVNTSLGKVQAQILGIGLQSTGKIIAVGKAGGSNYFVIARYTAAGALDSTFGTGGILNTSFGGAHEAAYAIAMDGDDFVVAGGSQVSGGAWSMAVARYHADGSLDASFGTGGKIVTPVGVSSGGFARAVAIQPDGRVVVAGNAFDGSSSEFVVARYTANGLPDAGFGVGGVLMQDMGANDDVANGIALDITDSQNTKIVAVGYSGDDLAVLKLNEDGSADTTFGANGILRTMIGGQYAYGYAVQVEGSAITIEGNARATSSNVTNVLVLRLSADGSLDTTF